LALPKLLALGKAKEKQVFLLFSSRFFVTLRLQREVFRFAQGNFFVSAIKINEFYFVLHSTFRNFCKNSQDFFK
jgi:hypothetical protein